VELIVAKIKINFNGPWRLFLGTSTTTADVNSVHEAREYIETHYEPAYHEKLKSRGSKKMPSIWASSNILLNGRNIKQLDSPVLKDGDTLDLLLIVAGG
jgi:molybdopterin converting factor small subunit